MAEEQNRTLQDKFMLRLPDGMRDRIRIAAEGNKRSMNQEIVSTLEDKYPALSLDIGMVGALLHSLTLRPVSPADAADRKAYCDALNLLLSRLDPPYHFKINGDAVLFIPFPMEWKEVSDWTRTMEALETIIIPSLRPYEREKAEAFLATLARPKS